MNTDEILDEITAFADRAHGLQMRKYTPEKYIVHPIRVMKTCREYTSDISILAAALLHDVLEDTPVSRDEILNFLKMKMAAADAVKALKLVEELTDVYIKEAYPQFNRRKRKELELERIIKTSAEAQTIKYADIMDNCSEIVGHDPGFAAKFLFECRAILRKATSGNKELHARALRTVEGAIGEEQNKESRAKNQESGRGNSV